MRRFLLKLLFPLLLLLPIVANAQTAKTQSDDELLQAAELDALVAPIALYPDPLLAQILMASTYPLEVVQADRWLNERKNLKGDALKAAVDKEKWDDSIKGLVATPSVLSMMSSKLDWTEKLGDAVLAQQPDVMDAVQRLRAKAQENNKLSSTKEQKVTVTQEQNKKYIVIEPTNPETIYVPYYNPSVVYGGWPYPAYPPYYFGYPGYVPGAILATGIAFGAGYALGRWASGGNYWGGSFTWNNNNININRPQVNPLGGGKNWQHNPAHRQGVRYNNPRVQQQFGNNNLRNGAQGRMDYRGRNGQQVLKPGGGQANLGDRGNRPSAATRPSGGGNRANSKPAGGRGGAGAATRPSGGGNRAATRPSGGGRSGGNALSVGSGRGANAASARGHSSMAGRGGGGGGAAMRGGGGGGGRGGGGGGGRGGGGGGRRSDIRLKHDISLLGRLDNGLGFYRFAYNGSDKAYVGVMAQEVQTVEPGAVTVGRDGYLRVFYRKLGIKLQTYDEWLASGARIPVTTQVQH